MFGRNFMAGALLLVAATGCDDLPEAQLDRGGLTFDFAAISERRFHIPKLGDPENLVDAGGWRGGEAGFHVYPSEVPGDAPVRREIKKAMKWTEGSGDERGVVIDGARLTEIAGTKYVKCSSGTWRKDVKLPHRDGSPARLSFRFKMRHTHAELGYAFVAYKSWDEKKKQYVTRTDVKAGYSYYDVWILPNEGASWNVFAKDFVIPAGIDMLEIEMRIDGGGELNFKDVGVVLTKDAPRPVALQLVPHGWLDDTFALSSGQPGVLVPAWKRMTADKLDDAALEFKFDFPKGVRYLGSTHAEEKTVRRASRPDGGETVRFSPKKTFKSGRKQFNSEQRPMVLVTTDLPVGTEALGTMQAFAGGKPVSDAVTIRYQIVEPVKALRPKSYLPGIMTYTKHGLDFGAAALNETYGRFLTDAGVRWVQGDVAADVVRAWKRGGLDLYFAGSELANGYYLGHNWRGRPKEDAFVGLKGVGTTTWDTYMDRSTCPLAVIEERKFFREKTVGEIMTRELEAADGMMPNWEPFMFVGKGCNCAKCKAAFEKYHRETGKDLRSFRSKLHGELVKTLDRHARALSGGEKSYGFIADITWRAVTSSWRDTDPASEFRPEDFLSSAKALSPWGPYVYWTAESPYVYQKRGPLAHFVAAKDMREQIDRDYPAEKDRLLLFGTTQALQCYDWITEPEWMGMALDCYLLNGWQGAKAYFFPDGYDARYWQAYARAATRAAKYEGFIFGGRRVDGAVTVEPVREYATPCHFVTLYIPKITNVSPLQSAAWERDGARIVGVLNFWDRGEAFFTLTCRDLKAGDYTVTDEDGVIYTPGGFGKTYSAEALAKGVRLMVGAARTKVFEIRPAAVVPAVKAEMTADAMDRFYAERRAALAEAAKADAVYEAANTHGTVDTKGEL